jgi:Ca2+-binding RTX toxin-like protein
MRLHHTARRSGIGAVALAALVWSATVPASGLASSVSRPLCHGHVATIVGSPGHRFSGTLHADVIVTNGGYGDAGGGDDLICVTGGPDLHQINAGAGDDVVDTRGALASAVTGPVVLGPGADRYRGGSQPDRVYAGTLGGTDRARDVIRTGSGLDRVHSGDRSDPNVPNDDVVLLGQDDDYAVVAGRAGGATIDGGTGINTLQPLLARTHSRVVLDNARERMTADGSTTLRFHRFTTFDISQPGTHLRFRGTAQRERLDLVPSTALAGPDVVYHLQADMGRNRDYVFSRFQVDGRVNGGLGADLLELGSSAHSGTTLDLAGSLVADSRSVTSFSGFEFVHLVRRDPAAPVVIDGTPGDDAVEVSDNGPGTAAQVSADMGDGNDYLMALVGGLAVEHGGPGNDELQAERGLATLYGDDGDDLLVGGPGDDVLVGGAGADTADGGNGTDRCDAETVYDCELPVG